MARCLRRKRFYSYTFYRTGGTTDGSNTLIPLGVYCEQNFMSKSKALRMLKCGELLGVSFKNRLYVCVCNEENQ